ncbi:MAG: dimethyl sulfoxide reductase anchor subunit family protein [Hyphomicrobiales bacterium]
MHPAYSVIIFTTASGAGYGLLALLGLFNAYGALPADRWFMAVSLVLALGLVTLGLLSSTFHLGHPERSWRAFSQWRSSWLSREGVAAVATYIPAGLFFLLSLFAGNVQGAAALLGLAASVLAVVTVYCTAMIYASLTTIRQWSNGWVVAGYLAMALASGAVLLVCLVALFGGNIRVLSALAASALVLALVIKLGYWRHIDTEEKTHTAEAATGLGGFGAVRQMAPPHTSANYVMKEMGFRVARKHAAKLRTYARLFGFFVPAGAVLLAGSEGMAGAPVFTVLAVVSCAAGLMIERWLFFGEAQHVVTLYYGEARA